MQIIKVSEKAFGSITRKHPWIFSGALLGKPSVQDGEIVEVRDHRDNFLAIGYYSSGASIAIRVLSFKKIEIDQSFWINAISAAHSRRKLNIFFDLSLTNGYRLIHGEGDGLPGLIIDIYGETAVIQCHTYGMYLQVELIAQVLLEIESLTVSQVFIKSKESIKNGLVDIQDRFAKGDQDLIVFKENGISFETNLKMSQKTGFYLDQRNNRMLLGKYSPDKSILNTFCYTGGFSLYALVNGAKNVVSVDNSKLAIQQLERNLAINKLETNRHVGICGDVMEYFKTNSDCFDIVVIDPPAFAKNMAKRHNAVQGYKRLNMMAAQKVNPGGYLFTFSCSQVVDDALFYNTVSAGILESGRIARVVHKLSQGEDHPVGINHPEGSYLKGLVLQID